MNSGDLLNLLTRNAKAYRADAQASLEHNRHMNEIDAAEVVQQRHIDAVLVDFINYIGIRCGVDYALYTKDLEEQQ